MTVPTIGVCGFGRCGTTMVMEMLAAGGIEPAGHTSERSHELVGDDLTVLVPRLAATDVRAITVRQPWASLIANGRKTIEWRTGRWPRWTGTVLIHSAATWAPGWKGRWFTSADLEGCDGAILDGIGVGDELGEDVNGSGCHKLDQWASRRVPTGAVIAVGRIVMVLPVHDALTITDYGLAEPWEPHFTVDEFAQHLTEWHANPEDFAEPDWLETPRSDQLAYSGGYAVPGNVGLCLADVVALDRPVPAKGRLGLWRPDPDLIAECMEQTR